MVGWNTEKINTKLLFKPFWIGSKPKLILKSFWMAMELERTMKTLCYWIIQHFTITTNYRWSYFGKECHWVTYVMQQQQKLLCKCHCSIFFTSSWSPSSQSFFVIKVFYTHDDETRCILNSLAVFYRFLITLFLSSDFLHLTPRMVRNNVISTLYY